MHSFQPSRGRVFFEVLCAMGTSASFAGAWMQTHATALLGTAGIAALYGLVRLFDLSGPRPTAVQEPQRIDFESEAADIVVPMVPPEERAEELPAEDADAIEVVEAAAPRSGSGRRTGGSRKGSGRRAKAPKAEKAADPAPVVEVQAPWPVVEPVDTAKLDEPEFEEEEFALHADGSSSQSHIQPLFEPEPFVRMPRQGFGRRGRI